MARELGQIGFPASTLAVRAHGANRPDPLLPAGVRRAQPGADRDPDE